MISNLSFYAYVPIRPVKFASKSSTNNSFQGYPVELNQTATTHTVEQALVGLASGDFTSVFIPSADYKPVNPNLIQYALTILN